MADAPPQATKPAPTEHKPHWWWHEDEYVAQGKVSVIAIFEIFLAVGFYYYLLPKFFTFPWVTVIAFLAVPLLLLSSKKSCKTGITLYRKAIKIGWPNEREIRAYNIMGFLVFATLSYGLADYLVKNELTGYSGGSFFLRSGIIGVIVAVAIGLMSDVLLFAVPYRGYVALTEYGAEIEITIFIVIMISIIVGATGAVGFLAALVFENISAKGGHRNLLNALGIFFHCLIIRIFANAKHWKEGVEAFSGNWHATLFVSNVRHAPILLPGVSKVYAVFNAATIMQRGLRDQFLIVVMFVSTTLYRWNIKANGLLLAPVAMGFSPNVWLPDPEAPHASPESKRRHTARMANRIALGALFTICLCVLGYVALSWMTVFEATELSKTIISLLPNWLIEIYNFSAFFPIGMRLVLATLGLLSLLWLIWCTYCMLSDYPKEVSEPVAYATMQPHVKKGFDAAAERIARWRKRAQMVFVFLTYAVFIKFAVAHWPAVWGKIINKSVIDLL